MGAKGEKEGEGSYSREKDAESLEIGKGEDY